MTEIIAEIFNKIFNDNVILATIFVSMVPIMELKGGIPFGMSEAFWGTNALSRWQALGWAYLGCSIVVVILYFTFVPIMKLLRKTKIFKGLANYIDTRIKKQTDKIEQSQSSAENSKLTTSESQQVEINTEQANVIKTKVQDQNITTNSKNKKIYKMLGVLAFVSIPLPLTGVWMGVCVAVILGLNFWETFVSVQVGNLIAGIIISTICVIFPQFTHWLIYIFIIIILIAIIYEIIKNKINKSKNKKNSV